MAIDFSTSFEAGVTTGWTDTSATPPTEDAVTVFDGAKSMRGDFGVVAQWVRRYYTTEPSVASCRVFYYLDSCDASNTMAIVNATKLAAAGATEIAVVTDGSGNPSFRLEIWDGAVSHIPATIPFSLDTWYRIEMKVDLSGSPMKVTFGTATGNGALTTHYTDYADGNSITSGLVDYWLLGSPYGAGAIAYFDAFSMGEAADYPIGPLVVAGQTLLPDADTTTTGWTTTPLFSKVNDASDATVITATAA